jgi:hypothetical protein
MTKSKVFVTRNPRVDANVADFVVCHRVAKLPIPYVSAQIEHCSKCKERIWVAHTSPKKPPKICYDCAAPIMEKDDDLKIIITERQAKEVEKYFRQKK